MGSSRVTIGWGKRAGVGIEYDVAGIAIKTHNFLTYIFIKQERPIQCLRTFFFVFTHFFQQQDMYNLLYYKKNKKKCAKLAS